MDVPLVKNFLFSETKKLQFRAEAFNVFNHMVLGVPGNSIAPSYSGGQSATGRRASSRHREYAARTATGAEVPVLGTSRVKVLLRLGLAQGSAQYPEGAVHFLFSRDIRRQKTQHGIVGAIDQ